MSRTPLLRTLIVGLTAAACLLGVAACTPTPSTPGAAGPTTAPTTTTPAVTPTTPPAPPAGPTYPATASEYAQAAVTAWASRDLARLDQLEVSDGELHTLYQCNGCYDTHFALVSCSGAAGSTYCLFFNTPGDSLRLRLSNPALGQARAVSTGSIWDPITFPSDDRAYAQEALDAWSAGNDNRLKLLTANQFTSAQLTALGGDPTASWMFYSSSGAAGTIGHSWQDGHGHTMTFLFTNGPAAPTTGAASQHRIREVLFNVI